MAYRNNTAEGSSAGTTVAASQAGSGDAFDTVNLAGSGTGVYSTDTKMHGSQSYYLTTTNTTGDLAVLEYDNINTTTVAVRFYMMLLGKPSGAIAVSTIKNATTAAASVLCTGTYKLQLQDTTATNINTFSLPLDSGIWYRIELGLTVATSTTGSATFAYYIGDATTAVETAFTTTTSNFGTTNVIKALYGKTTSTAASATIYMDDIGINDTTATLIGGFSATASDYWIGA